MHPHIFRDAWAGTTITVVHDTHNVAVVVYDDGSLSVTNAKLTFVKARYDTIAQALDDFFGDTDKGRQIAADLFDKVAESQNVPPSTVWTDHFKHLTYSEASSLGFM